MNGRSAKELLTVIVESPDESGMTEASGFIAYGLGAPRSIARQPPLKIAKFGRSVNNYRLHGEYWEVIRWDIPIIHWPSGEKWEDALFKLLETVIDRGAKVAWIGDETALYSDPPYLFDPEYMQGAVFAWRTADGRAGGQLDPDQPLVGASKDDLLLLRAYAEGLADVD